MYTQCPDCEIAFKVTADVLKQAAGKVCCGSCENAFNALLYLTEQMPKQPTPETVGADLPELRPETTNDDDRFTSTIIIPEKGVEEKALEDSGDESQSTDESDKNRVGIIASVVALVLILIVQFMHQSREALATIPAFSNTVGQVYRVLGRPVQPSWDITGWRFEVTKGNIEDEEALTVYSRLGNNSDGPLPYPLISISLADPNEYLPINLDPRKLVKPGNTFSAVITIKLATKDATGFKLNVCYRSSDRRLRCAIDDFK
jgi:predicted Zn finger-like uncharacterized protein